MTTLVSNASSEPSSGLVEVLTLPGIDVPLGYKLSGVRDGPTAIVLANSHMVDAIFDRLSQLPTLPWLQGNIYLLSLEVMDCVDARILKATIEGISIDESILLPWAEPANQDANKVANQGYWTTLRLCARLGIIQGRGVPRGSNSQMNTVFSTLNRIANEGQQAPILQPEVWQRFSF